MLAAVENDYIQSVSGGIVNILGGGPTKVSLFWSRHESKNVTGTGHYAWTSRRTQEAGKTTDLMA
jgi:hypothetical protein